MAGIEDNFSNETVTGGLSSGLQSFEMAGVNGGGGFDFDADDFAGAVFKHQIAKCSADTALRDIRELLDRSILVQNPGSGRSTSYRLTDAENVSD